MVYNENRIIGRRVSCMDFYHIFFYVWSFCDSKESLYAPEDRLLRAILGIKVSISKETLYY